MIINTNYASFVVIMLVYNSVSVCACVGYDVIHLHWIRHLTHLAVEDLAILVKIFADC